MIKKANQYKGDFFLGIVLLYKVILDWSYYILSDSAYSMQFALDINAVKVLFSYIILFLVCYATYHTKAVTVYFVRLIIFFVITPISCAYGMRNENSLFFLLTAGTFLGVEILCLHCSIKKKKGKKVLCKKMDVSIGTDEMQRVPNKISKCLGALCMILAIVTVIFMYMYNGLPSLKAMNLYKVYEVRSAYNATKYLDYLVAVVTCVIVPFGIAEGISTKKYWKSVFYGGVQLALFFWTGNKIYLFSLMLIIAVMVLYCLKWSSNMMFLGFTGASFLGVLSKYTSISLFDAVFSFYNRRMVLDSATLKYFYYDYFIVKGNPRTGLGGTILAPFVSSEASGNYRFDLSTLYTGFTSNANTGLYGGDIACLGWGAFIIVPLLLVIMMWFVERTVSLCGMKFSLVLFTYIIYRLNETCIYLFFFDFTGVYLAMLVYFYRFRRGRT